MPTNIRDRDCIVLFKGDTYPVTISDEMAAQGWRGGQGVQWVDPVNRDEFKVTYSDGLYAGFMLWGSDEDADRYTSMTLYQPTYKMATACCGGWLIMTTSYEKYTYASRTGGGVLVPLVYNEGDRLVFSVRGFFTKEDEWTLSGDPRAPNSYYIAFVAQVPTAQNNYYITVQTSI